MIPSLNTNRRVALYPITTLDLSDGSSLSPSDIDTCLCRPELSSRYVESKELVKLEERPPFGLRDEEVTDNQADKSGPTVEES